MVVTLRQMQYVIAVSETGSFSKAAELCAADQSTVSQQVKTFEERLGTAIFDRNYLPIKTTEEGLKVVEKCKEIILKVEDLMAPFKKPPHHFNIYR